MNDFDFQMDNSGEFIRGFWRWSGDSHNWGKQVDVNVYVVVSYATDCNIIHVALVSETEGKRKELSKECVVGFDFNEVMKVCEKLSSNYYEYFNK